MLCKKVFVKRFVVFFYGYYIRLSDETGRSKSACLVRPHQLDLKAFVGEKQAAGRHDRGGLLMARAGSG